MHIEAKCVDVTLITDDCSIGGVECGGVRVAFKTRRAPVEVARKFYGYVTGGQCLNLSVLGGARYAVMVTAAKVECDGRDAWVEIEGVASASGDALPVRVDIDLGAPRCVVTANGQRGGSGIEVTPPPCALLTGRQAGKTAERGLAFVRARGGRVEARRFFSNAMAAAFQVDWGGAPKTKDGVQRPAGYTHAEPPEECKACGGAFHPGALCAGQCRTCRPPARGAIRIVDDYAAIQRAALKLGRTLW